MLHWAYHLSTLSAGKSIVRHEQGPEMSSDVVSHQKQTSQMNYMYLVNGLLTLERRAAFWQKFNWNVPIPSRAHHKQNVYIINISADLFSVSKYAQSRQIAPRKHERTPRIHQNIRERPSCTGRITYKQFRLRESHLFEAFLLIFPSWQFNFVHRPTMHQITHTPMLIGPSCGAKRY